MFIYSCSSRVFIKNSANPANNKSCSSRVFIKSWKLLWFENKEMAPLVSLKEE
jgi:hypothetical protein